MKKLLLLFLITVLFSCEKNETNDVLPHATVDVVINTNLPEYQNLQIATGWVYIAKGPNKGLQGILVLNTGLTPKYKAFERACPNNDCNSPMVFDGNFKLKCSCDNSEYSILDGSPQTNGNSQFAREYQVVDSGSGSLHIRN